MTAQLASVLQHIHAGATIITPNVRLSRYLAQQYDLAQLSNDKSAWIAADIVPLGLFYSRLLQQVAPHKILLSAVQNQTIWEDVIRASPAANGLMSVPQAARLAQEAWQQTCSWDLLSRMKQMAVHDDNLAFLTWVSAVAKILRNNDWLDNAALPDALLKALADTTPNAHKALPEKICLYGFDLETPQQQRFFSTLQLRDVAVSRAYLQDAPTSAHPTRMACDSAAQEILNAAHWAKRLQEQSPHKLRIAFVVPDLANRKNAIVRTLTDTFFPNARAQLDFNQKGRALADTAFNVSLGEPLSSYAPVNDALLLLRFSLSATATIPWDETSPVLLSPFIYGATTEAGMRFRFDALLRRYGGFHSSFSTLHTWLSQPDREAPSALLAIFHAVQKIRIAHGIEAAQHSPLTKTRLPKLTLSPAKWGDLIWQILNAWGYPGELGLDSHTFQVLTKFEGLIEEFAKLNQLDQTMLSDGFDAEAMLTALNQLAAQTPFQAEALSEEPLVHVLGVLESTAQHFDGIWVMGMRAEAWPLPISPNPFIPQALQRVANMPEGTHSAAHALDATITKNWLNACNEICFSYVLTADGAETADSTTVCSSLVAQYPQKIAENFAAQASPHQLGPIVETALLPLAQGQQIRGGAALWRDFAACPFKAYARHRLQTSELATPEPGLSATQRGTLVHRALALFWEATYTHTALCAQTPEERHAAIHRCVARTLSEAQTRLPALNYAMAEIEALRLTRLLALWLTMEETRAPFSVDAIESKRDLTIAGVAVSLTLDRLDTLEDGTVALIDYKSGRPTVSTWLGPRMDEPQLPLYCAASDAHVSAVAFGSVRRQQNNGDYDITGFIGVSAVADLLPNVGTVEQQSRIFAATASNWDELTVQWEKATTAIAVQFVQGDTAIAPKAGNATCAQCACQPLCRIEERAERTRDAGYNDQDVTEVADEPNHE
jgi:ATP-dependent helicase/nuclease subunit B